MDIIVIHGAPGCGKTTIAQKLHAALKSPWFEFGWIPEHRNLTPHTEISYEEEAQIAFENLALVCRNYVRHGFENILLSDLEDRHVLSIPVALDGLSYTIFTLYSESDDVIKQRILTRDNGNIYRDYEAAFLINQKIQQRSVLLHEIRIRSDNLSPDGITKQILSVIA